MTWMDLCQSLATDLNGLAASDLLHFEIGGHGLLPEASAVHYYLIN